MHSENLIAIDIGNTRTKIGIFKDNEIISLFTYSTKNKSDILEGIKQNIHNYSIYQLAFVNVGLSNHELNFILESLRQEKTINNPELNYYLITGNSSGYLNNLYSTPETLGSDRWAAINAAYCKFPNTSIIVISLGTALTIDYINSRGEYVGGIIAPGLQMRFSALHHYTQKLPLLHPEPLFHAIGNSTENAMRVGVQLGMQAEIEYFAHHFGKESVNTPVTLITGGYMEYFNLSLKNFYQEPNLVLEGIYYLYPKNER